jgi:hypothetical protein
MRTADGCDEVDFKNRTRKSGMCGSQLGCCGLRLRHR